MADPNINIKITGDSKSAQGALKGLTSSLGEASDGMGSSGQAATKVGEAIVAFATKGVLAYKDLGVEVGKFHDSTGISAEDSSRLIEVANNHGVATDALASSMGKMEKALGKNGDAFKQYGVEVVKGKDGQIDATATFESSIDALNKIQDPMKKAEAGAAMFGKGWQSMSELIGEGSAKLKQDLAAVDPANIMGAGDVDKARGLREAFDSVKNSVEGLLLTIGKSLAPVVSQFANFLGQAAKQAGPLVELIGSGLSGAMSFVLPIVEQVIQAITGLVKVFKEAADFLGGPSATAAQKYGIELQMLQEQATAAGASQEQWTRALRESNGDVGKMRDSLLAMGVAFKPTLENWAKFQAGTATVDQQAKELGLTTEQLGQMAQAADYDVTKYTAAIYAWADAHDPVKVATEETDKETRRLAVTVGDLTPKLAEQKSVIESVADANRDSAEQTKVAAAASDAHTASVQSETKAQYDLIAADDEIISRARAAIDSKYAYVKAQEDATKAEETLVKTMGDHKASMTDIRDATDAARDSVIQVSQAYVKSKGASLDSRDGIDLQIKSLQDQEKELGPKSPLRAAIDEYIADLKNIPSNINTKIQSTIVGTTGPVRGGSNGYATGTDDAAAGVHDVSEDGAELVVGRRAMRFRGGEGVVPADRTKALLRGAAAASITNHFYGVTDVAEINRLQAREYNWLLRSATG